MTTIVDQPKKYEIGVIILEEGRITMCLEDILKAEEQAAYIALNGFRHRKIDGKVHYYPVHRIHEVTIEEVSE